MHLFDPLSPHHEVLAREGISADTAGETPWGRGAKHWLPHGPPRLPAVPALNLHDLLLLSNRAAREAAALGSFCSRRRAAAPPLLAEPAVLPLFQCVPLAPADAPLLDIVFIHGIRGGAFATWRREGVLERGQVSRTCLQPEPSQPGPVGCWATTHSTAAAASHGSLCASGSFALGLEGA